MGHHLGPQIGWYEVATLAAMTFGVLSLIPSLCCSSCSSPSQRCFCRDAKHLRESDCPSKTRRVTVCKQLILHKMHDVHDVNSWVYCVFSLPFWIWKFGNKSWKCPFPRSQVCSDLHSCFPTFFLVGMLRLAKTAVADPLRGLLGFSLGVPAAVLVGPFRLICAESSQAISDDVRTMAKMSNVMYKESNQREAEARKHGWELLHPFNEPKHAIFTKGTVMLVAFQGTSKRGDFQHDAMILFNLNDLVPLDEVKADLRLALATCPDIREVQVTGHSLGGALAAMLAKSLKEDPDPDFRLNNLRGHIFNPGSTLDLDKYLTEERWLGC